LDWKLSDIKNIRDGILVDGLSDVMLPFDKCRIQAIVSSYMLFFVGNGIDNLLPSLLPDQSSFQSGKKDY